MFSTLYLSDFHEIRYGSPLQKFVEQAEFRGSRLADGYTLLKNINEILPVFSTFI